MKQTKFEQSDVYAAHDPKVVERVVLVDRPVQIERTSKKYKIWIVIGYTLFFGGIIGTFYSLTHINLQTGTDPILDYLSLYAIISGLIIIFTVGFLAWWHHG